MTELNERIAALIEPSLTAMGYDLVRVQLSGGRYQTLQIMAERTDGGPMLVDHCAEISRAVSALLDVEDPIPGAHSLEVSSPGIDRPLIKAGDFERFAGYEAKVELKAPIDGRRRFQGRLAGCDGRTVRLDQDGHEVALAYEDIAKAKLVLTDELLKAAQAAQEEGETR
jgi:ribosome maturation factor RimP